MDNDIPPMRDIEDLDPIRTQADLERHWRMLMGPLGFSERLIWMQLLDRDGRCTPLITQIGELPRLPTGQDEDGLTQILEHFADDDASMVFLLTRPGRRGMSASDLAWARMVRNAARRAGMKVWPVHRANDDELVVCSPDDLAA